MKYITFSSCTSCLLFTPCTAELGIRYIQMQRKANAGTIHLKHGYCYQVILFLALKGLLVVILVHSRSVFSGTDLYGYWGNLDVK